MLMSNPRLKHLHLQLGLAWNCETFLPMLLPSRHSLNAHAMIRLVSLGPVKLPTTDLMTAVGLCAVTT